ncbi:unnamed protein product [Prorocentrum cordatum]|uniref:Uncharacterized protein n=1 Tax=Prorocentrum cordatum TaxID=2364126 RepID=A0ABN9UD51_9DINO|nr:unnamed protein product [Polarella glacialis]
MALIKKDGPQLSSEEKAHLTARVGQVYFFEGHDVPIMEALAGLDDVANGRSSKRKMGQDYRPFLAHISRAGWSRLLGDEVPAHAALNILVQRIIRLGGTNPCEYSMKFVTSTWMFITDKNVDQLNYWAKKKNLEHVKREFRRQADKAPAPPVFIQDLPGSPAELLTKFPQIYHLAFTAEDVPSACPLDLRKLRELDDSYTCTEHLQRAAAFKKCMGQRQAIQQPRRQRQQHALHLSKYWLCCRPALQSKQMAKQGSLNRLPHQQACNNYVTASLCANVQHAMDVMQRKRDDAKQRAAMKRPAAAKPPIASGGDADEAYVEATQTLAKISVEDFVGWSSSDKDRTKNAFASAAYGKAKTRALGAKWPKEKALDLARQAYRRAAAVYDANCAA